MSLESNVNDLAQRVAEEFNSLQAQIAALSGGGGGGGGGSYVPTFRGNFSVFQTVYSGWNTNAPTIVTGPDRALTGQPEVNISSATTGFAKAYSPFTYNGNTMQMQNGGIIVQNTGGYRIKVRANVAFGNHGGGTEQQYFEHRLQVGQLIMLRSLAQGKYITTSGSGTTYTRPVFNADLEGVVMLTAGDVLSMSFDPMMLSANPSGLYFAYNFNIESLF